MLVIAGGVETPAECDILVELRCYLLQGYQVREAGPGVSTL